MTSNKKKLSAKKTTVGTIANLGSVPSKQMDLVVKGNTLTNVVANGNFANGTTGWSASGATLNANNNTLSVTGTGVTSFALASSSSTTIPCVSGKKIYSIARMRVTNNESAHITIAVGGSTGGVSPTLVKTSTPVQDQWYTLAGIYTITDQTGFFQIKPYHSYIDKATANGKVMEVQRVLAIDMGTDSSNPLYNKTQAEMDALTQRWFDGTKSTIVSGVKLLNKNLTKLHTSLSDMDYNHNSAGTISNDGNKTTVAGVIGNFSYLDTKAIPVKPNTNYKLLVNGYIDTGANPNSHVYIFPSSVAHTVGAGYLSAITLQTTQSTLSTTFTTDSSTTAVYIRYYPTINTSTATNMYINSITLSETATGQLVNIITTPLTLRSVGLVQDKINLSTGVYTKYISDDGASVLSTPTITTFTPNPLLAITNGNIVADIPANGTSTVPTLEIATVDRKITI